MEINWSVVGWLAIVVFVYLFGIFEGRGQGRKRRIAEEQEEKKNQPAPEPETIKVDDPGILRIKNDSEAFSIDLDGTHVDGSLSANQRKRLIEILNLIRPLLDVKPTPAPIAPAPQPKPAPTLESRLDAIGASSFVPPPAPVPIVKPSLGQILTRAPKKKDDKAEGAPTTMVGQINAILQLRIANTALATQGITMSESLSGAVNVYVGVNKYEGIEDVPNEEVKAAIRAAIAEWEKKYTPGL